MIIVINIYLSHLPFFFPLDFLLELVSLLLFIQSFLMSMMYSHSVFAEILIILLSIYSILLSCKDRLFEHSNSYQISMDYLMLITIQYMKDSFMAN
jgi:hypothetical protein